MKKNLLLAIPAFLILVILVLPAYAGGPLFVFNDGRPVRWARSETRGGTLNSQTVDAQGRVLYRVDSGTLGPLTNEQATKFVDRIFKLYTDIPTCTLEFVNGGRILNPQNGQPVDINGSNAGLVLSSRNPSFQNPIVFDSDGSITGNGGVLGFFGFLNVANNGLQEGLVVLNGRAVNSVGVVPFIGVFTHEFGHFAGPLDHSQINGGIASGASTNAPDGFTLAQRYDVFAPFVETVYPFLFETRSSKLATQGFGSSGSFVASIHFDDVTAMSALYPTPGYLPSDSGSQFGGISGRILLGTNQTNVPISGLNVVARRVSLGDYPPAPTLDPYGGQAIPVDEDGAPLPPAPRNEIDPLLTSTSIVSGVLGGNGVFNFVGLPPGDYLVSVETINPDALGGSSIGQRDPQIGFIIAENYNGANESSDPNRDRPREFSPVRVNAGSITTGIDFFLNNYGSSITSADEQENNDAKKAAQRLSGDQIISGNVSESDSSRIKVDFGGNNGSLNIHDLYRVTLTQNTSLALFLDAENTSSDIDLFLFSRDLKNGTVPINSSSIISVSFTATGSEAIVENLAPGTYFIGVSGALGTTKYKLTVAQRR